MTYKPPSSSDDISAAQAERQARQDASGKLVSWMLIAMAVGVVGVLVYGMVKMALMVVNAA